jgi:hypothetical protein
MSDKNMNSNVIRKGESLVSSVKAVGYFILFIIMIVGTYLFSVRNESKYIVPFTLISYIFFVIISFYLVNIIFIPVIINESKSDNFKSLKFKIVFSDLFTIALAWLFWLLYGLVFNEIADMFGKVWIYIQTITLMILVLLSYIDNIQKNRILMWTIISAFFILVNFFPSKDSVATRISNIVLMTKVLIFFILYVINDYSLRIPDQFLKNVKNNITLKMNPQKTKNGSNNNNSNNYDIFSANNLLKDSQQNYFNIEEQLNETKINIREKCLRMRFIGLLRAYWVLCASKYLLIFSMLQILPILMFTYLKCLRSSDSERNLENKLNNRNTTKTKKRTNVDSNKNVQKELDEITIDIEANYEEMIIMKNK